VENDSPDGGEGEVDLINEPIIREAKARPKLSRIYFLTPT